MKLLSASGSVVLNQTIGVQKITLDFQPKVVFFMTQPDTANIVTEVANGHFSYGFSDGITQYMMRVGATNGAAFGHVHNGGHAATIVAQVNDPPHQATIDYQFALVTLDADGFTINITDPPPINYRMGYLALGGASLQAKVGYFRSSGGGNVITGVGFAPQAVVSTAIQFATIPANGQIFNMCMGFNTTVAGGGGSFCVGANASYNSNPVVANRFIDSYWNYNLSSSFGGGITTFGADGFSTSYHTNPVGYYTGYVALNGGGDIFFKAGLANLPASGVAQYTGIGFIPKAGIFSTVGKPTGGGVDATFSMGFAGRAVNGRYMNMFRDQAAVNTTNIAHASHDQRILRVNTNGGVISEDVDISNWISDGFELNVLTGGALSQFGYFVAGDTDPVEPIPPVDPTFTNYQGFVV
jgi:hypothetical protein